jgi:predicted nucleic acid-binding protein
VILVDTSAWVDFFRGRGRHAMRVDDLLEHDEVALCGPVVTEIRRGLRSPGDRARVLPLLNGCHVLPQPILLWEEAGKLGWYLGRRVK